MEYFLILFNFSCLTLLALIFVYWFFYPIISAPFHPSSNEDILKMFSLAKLDRKDKFIDLGSGDGRAVLAASRVCDYAVGVEHNPFLNLFARFMAIISANGELKFKNKNLWKEDLGEYDVIFIYLLPTYMKKLKLKLERECKPGTRIVTNSFPLDGWKAARKQAAKSGNKHYYLYEIGKQH
jgi:hypothetical protein